MIKPFSGQEAYMEFLGAAVGLSVILVSSYALIAEVQNVKGSPSTSCDYPAIYNFGDSNSDTGGIAAAFFPMVSPCGDTYFHRPVGRASDGRLIIDFIGKIPQNRSLTNFEEHKFD